MSSLSPTSDCNHESESGYDSTTEPYDTSPMPENQMGYYEKYGRSPSGPNSTAALNARIRELLANAKQVTGKSDDRSTQTEFDQPRGHKRHRCDSSTDGASYKENLATNLTSKPKRIERGDRAVSLMWDAVILSQDAVRLLQEAIMLLAEAATYPRLEDLEGTETIEMLRKWG